MDKFSKKAILALADGTVFFGRPLGSEGETAGEVVFNTAMTGYQEILTDPSYKGQIVMMTCPHMGNYGLTREDKESRRMWAEGFVVRESSRSPSNWRAEHSLHESLVEGKVVGIEGIDTRDLTRHIRDHGSQMGVISHVDLDPRRAVERARETPELLGRDLVSAVTCSDRYEWQEGTGVWNPSPGWKNVTPTPEMGKAGEDSPASSRRGQGFRVVVYDFGVKHNILRRLVDVGCTVTVVPGSTKPESVLALDPDGIVLSNGPGDPEGVPYAVEAVRALIGKRPILGICLGHQVLGLAFGLGTFKLKFGHHGANHPVMDLRTRKMEITSQNHNFSVQAAGVLDPGQDKQPVFATPYGTVSLTHLSLNDHSVEGMVCRDQPVLSVQYHPEAAPGPHDSSYLFQHFTHMMERSHA